MWIYGTTMPKYVYSCSACQTEFETFHGMKETLDLCVKCGEMYCLERIPQLTSIIRKDNTGQQVKDAIEENKKILKQMKKEAKRSDYE